MAFHVNLEKRKVYGVAITGAMRMMPWFLDILLTWAPVMVLRLQA